MKKLSLFLVLILFAGCRDYSEKSGTIQDFIPENANLIFKFNDWDRFKAGWQDNNLISGFQHSLFSENDFYNYLKPQAPGLLCFSVLNDSVTAVTFISKNTKDVFAADSVSDKMIETLEIGKIPMQRITLQDQIHFTADRDSVFIASTSQQLLMDILNGKTEKNPEFTKTFELPATRDFMTLVKNPQLFLNDSAAVRLASRLALDITLESRAVQAHGISLVSDTVQELLRVFEGQIPQENHAARITPLRAKAVMSFTFSDPEKFLKNLSRFRKDKTNPPVPEVFETVNEIGILRLENESLVFLKSIDKTITEEVLAKNTSLLETFRDVEIKTFDRPGFFAENLKPLIDSESVRYVFEWDGFFVFSPAEELAKQLIGWLSNNTVLASAGFYEQTAANRSGSSSLLIHKLGGDFGPELAGFFQPVLKSGPQTGFKNYPLATFQFSFDRDFAHVLFSCSEQDAVASSVPGGVSELFSLQLKTPLLNFPQIFQFEQNRSAVVQDVENNLHFISENGNILWSKKLDGPVLGEIQGVDLYRNGKTQLAFTTRSGLYILDRNGNDVSAFPLRFKDEITLPLAVFDYDSNRQYRFAVTQRNQILLFDRHGKRVTGFDFKPAASPVVFAPRHIRMGNKDYIVAAEENGKLHILNRMGKTRIPVSRKFEFSQIPVTSENNRFVIITQNNTKEEIDQNGKFYSQTLEVGDSYYFTTLKNVKATLDGNLLRINGKLAELPIGIYSSPRIFEISGKSYVMVSENHEKKLYVFDSSASLLEGFPVYGISGADPVTSRQKNSGIIVAKGDDDTVIGYQFK